MTQKTLAIVGSGPGLGLSIARRFGREGYRVALVGRSEDKLLQITSRLKDEGIEAVGFQGDASDPVALKAAFDAIKARFGTIDVLEYSPISPIPDPSRAHVLAADAAVVEALFRVVTLGAVVSVGEVLPEMLARNSGTIIITTAASTVFRLPFLGAFSAAGGAARNYGLQLHAALRDTGVFAATVCLAVAVQKDDPVGDPDLLAEIYYQLHLARSQGDVLIDGSRFWSDPKEFGGRENPLEAWLPARRLDNATFLISDSRSPGLGTPESVAPGQSEVDDAGAADLKIILDA
jgi:NAD(P)-dependent dehydrogenase (short-subunit alcohol dehydrogenase family)